MKMTGSARAAAFALGFVILLCAACNQMPASAGQDASAGTSGQETALAKQEAPPGGEGENLDAQLEEIAELERSGRFVPGLGLAESALRERSGDYAGAVLATFKELSWAYGRALEGVTREAVAEGLARVQDLGLRGTEEAGRAALAFFEGRWEEAERLIKKTFTDTAVDSFSNWMLLVCALERGDSSREVRDAYSAIRARYAGFPEYWYRGARRLPEQTARSYAEICVNLSASGPYAGECRRILAEAAGMDGKDGAALKTRTEAEGLVNAAIQADRPEILAELLPMLSLPDNPYTLYVSGALRALNSAEPFRRWLSAEAAKAKGRLAERLSYIVRG